MTNGGKLGKHKGNCSYCGIYGYKANVCNKIPKFRNEKGGKTKRGNGNEGKFNTPFPFSCYICNKRGHKAMDCPTKRKGSNGVENEDRDEANFASEYSDIALFCNEELDSAFISLEEGEDRNEFKNLWVGDSGATCHMVCSDKTQSTGSQ
jgi:hypothetical protein